MAELYDNAKLANSQYVPKFVGSTYENMKDAADRLDVRYRENRDLSDRIAVAMANDKYHTADQHIGDKLYNDFTGTIDEVAKSENNFENSTGVIAKAGRDYATNKARMFALENARKHEAYQQQKAEFGAEGQDFTKEFKGTLNEDGTINKFQHKLEKKLDYDKQKETYFNQIEADLKQQGYTQDQINAEFLKSTIEGGISKNKIGSYLEKAFNRHRTTAEYDQEKRALIRDGLSPDQADADIRKSLLSTGLERVHGVTKEDLQRHSEHYLKGLYSQEPEVPFTPTVPGVPKINTTLKPLQSAGSSLYKDQSGQAYQIFEKDGTPVDVKEAESNLNKVNGAGGRMTINEMYDLRPVDAATEAKQPGSYEYQTNHLTNNLSERQMLLWKKENGSAFNKDTYQAAKELADKSAKQVAESGEQLTKENTPIYENYLRGAGLNAPTVLEGETQPRTLKEIVSSMGLDPRKDKVEFVPSLLNRTSPNSSMGANIEGTIYVNGHPLKSFSTRLSDQFDSASTELNDVLQNSLYKGSDTYTKEQPKVSSQLIKTNDGEFAPVYYTTTIPTKGSKYPFDTEVHVGLAKITGYNGDGSPIVEEPKYNGETYTASEFKAKQTEISKRKLKNVYASGQMKEQDLKAFGNE